MDGYDYEANVIRNNETLYNNAIKRTEDELASPLFGIKYPSNQDAIRKILEKRLEHYKTRFVGWPIEKCVFQDSSLIKKYMHRLPEYPYGRPNRELTRERLDLAVQKVIGMPNYAMFVEEYASDVGFQIFPTEFEVSKHHMDMILGCQKSGIYEEHIPRILTMTWFGRSYDPNEALTENSNTCPNSFYCYHYIYDRIVSLKHGDKFNFSIPESYCGPVRTLFDPELLHKTVVWEKERVVIDMEYNYIQADPLSRDSEESETRRRSIIESYDAVIQAAREFID